MVALIHFNSDEFMEGGDLQERFGLRGRNMMQLAGLKTPIAPGFMIDSSDILKGDLGAALSIDELKAAVGKIEGLTGKTFNGSELPLFFKVVISPSIQIGSIKSLHTVGINDEVVKGFAGYCGDEFAYQEYKLFMEQFGQRVLGMKAKDFEEALKGNVEATNEEICKIYREKVVPDFPQDGYEQLHMALAFNTKQYLDDPMNEDIEAGVLVQMMVYGNFGKDSYNGNFYTRNIVTGESVMSGLYGQNEFDTPPDKAQEIHNIKADYMKQFQEVSERLEKTYLDIRQIKFIIEEGKLWVIEQNQVDTKSTQAEVRTLLDLHKKGLVDKKKLAMSIPPNQLQDLLHPVIDHGTTKGMKTIVGGMAGSPGAAVGRVCYSTPALLAEYRRCSLMGVNSDLILIMPHTDAEDVEAIELGEAVIASVGGYASHAPVVARSLRKPCLLYSDIEFKDGYAIIGGEKVKEFETVSIEVPTYTDPTIWVGEADLVYPDTSTNGLEEFIQTIGEVTEDFKVFAIANSHNEAKVAMRLGAQGLGMFPIDKLIQKEQTLEPFREALLMSDPEKRKSALKAFEKALEKECVDLFKLVGDAPISIRLLNGPLTEFIPHDPDELKAFIGDLLKKHKEITEDELNAKVTGLRNINPMMGLRGSRIGVAYPDLYQAQITALLKAGYTVVKDGNAKLNLDLLVPGVMSDAEMRFIRHGRNIESAVIPGVHTLQNELAAEWKLDVFPFNVRVGALIELPASALMAGHMAKQSEFFTIDTNMLTQTTNGMSDADINTFLPAFNQYDILKDNPFQILSVPVKELIGATVHFGKITRPDLQIGMSGNHASDPVNIDFAFNIKLNYVTCVPYGVPIAKLAVAQYILSRESS